MRAQFVDSFARIPGPVGDRATLQH